MLRQRGASLLPQPLPLRLDTFASDNAFKRSRLAAFSRLIFRSWDKHIADLASGPSAPLKWSAVQYDTRTDSSSDGKENKVGRSLRRASPTLAKRREIHVVVHRCRRTQGGFEQTAQRNVPPPHS